MFVVNTWSKHCVSVCVCACACMYVHTCMYIHVHACVCVCVCVDICVYACACMYCMCMHVCTCVGLCTCSCTCLLVYVHTRAYVCVYTMQASPGMCHSLCAPRLMAKEGDRGCVCLCSPAGNWKGSTYSAMLPSNALTLIVTEGRA